MLNANIKELESSIGVLQSEKDEMDVRCSVATDKNKALSEKMMKVEEEKKDLMNEKEFLRQELLNWKYQWINEGK